MNKRKQHHKSADPGHHVRDYWIFILLFIGILTLVGIAEVFYFANRKKDVKKQVSEELLGIADIKIRAVSRWKAERMSDANFIFKNESIAVDANNSSDPDALARMHDWMNSMISNRNHRHIALLSREGKVLLRIPDTGWTDAQPEILLQAEKRESFIFSDFSTGVNDELYLQIVVPLYQESGTTPQLTGFIQLVIDPEDALFEVVKTWARPSNSAEVFLVTQQGNDVVYVSDLRHRTAPGKLRLPTSRQRCPAVMGLMGEEGFVEGIDYRNVSVFAAVRRLPNSPWVLVAKIDQREVYQDLDAERNLAIIVFVLAILATGAFLLWIVKRIQVQEAREAAEEIQRSRALLNAIIEGTNDLIYAKDREGLYVMINQSTANIWGKPASEVYGKDATYVETPEEAEQIRRIDKYVLETGQVITFEEPFISRNGEVLHFLTTKGPILQEGGEITGVFGISREITLLKKTEGQLRNFQHAVEQSPASILITDTEGSIEYVNRRFTEVSGYTAPEVIGKNPRTFKSGRVKPETYAQLWRTIKAGKEWRGELCNKKKDGSLYWEDVFIGPMRNENKEIKHFIAIKQDITAQMEMEKHLMHAQRMESIGTLAGGIAHDLNNVLAPVLISVELLRERSHDDLSRQLLATAESAVLRGREIIRQVLSFARGLEGEKITIQPRHVLKEVENILRETFPRSIQIVTDIDPDLALVSADVTQLHQVLMNLCVNARDAMGGKGTLTLKAQTVSEEELNEEILLANGHKPHVCLSVTDTGPGISPEVMNRIFDPFFTTKGVGKGTGLGLSTTYTIVRKHNGFIYVDSEQGRGAEFRVFLPGVEGEAAFDSKSKGEIPRGRGEGILVVDDEAFVRNVTRQILEGFGYTAFVAESGKEATQLYKEHRADIAMVITDWMMPEMDGAATIRALRQIDPDVRVVVSTGLVEESTGDPKFAPNVRKILNKPYGAQVLLETIRDVLM